jgi:hypothetical protein
MPQSRWAAASASRSTGRTRLAWAEAQDGSDPGARSAGDAADGGAVRDADLRQLGERRLKCVDVGPSAPATHTRQRFLADLRAGVPVSPRIMC